MQDKKIIQKLKEGDYSAFKYLYLHYGMVENYVLKNSGSVDDAKDLFQNAMVTLYKNIKKEDFELTSKISTYIFSIAKNNWLKKITRAKEKPVENHHFESTNSSYELGDIESKNVDIGSYLLGVLRKVGEPCMSLITLFHFDKLEWDVIAQKLNYKTAHAARNQKYKCFLKIRKLIPESDKIKLFGYGN